jgi:hypothetical protein
LEDIDGHKDLDCNTMRTLEFLSTLLVAVVHYPNVCVAVPQQAEQQQHESQQHAASAKLRHRRHILRIDPTVLDNALRVPPPRDQATTRTHHGDDRDNAYGGDLVDEWARLMKRGKDDQSLSFSMPIAMPNNRPVVAPNPAPPPPSPKATTPTVPQPTPPSPTVLTPVEPLPPPVDTGGTTETPVAPLPPPVTPPIEVPEGSAVPTTLEPSPAAVPSQETPFPSNQESGGGGGGPGSSECESLDRADAILAAVETVSPNVDLDPATPTGFAVDWLTNDDPAMLDPCTENITQRYSLATLYSSTVGTSWVNSTGWLSAAPICVSFANPQMTRV